MKRIILKAGEEKRLLAGHPWVYDNEVDRILGNSGSASLQAGEIADVETPEKTYIGRAFVNPASKIIARLYSPSKEGVDKGFFKGRIRKALARRFMYDLTRESARIVFAEADFLPGLMVDRFVGWDLAEAERAVSNRPLAFRDVQNALGPPRAWLAVQFLIAGMDCRRDDIVLALEEVFAKDFGPLAGIVEKSGAAVRELEGLPKREGLLKGTLPSEGILLFENDFPFCARLEQGQKTGHYLDQKDNRRRLSRYVPVGGRVLDACAYTGGFGIHALRYGAGEAVAVDASRPALDAAQKNADLNGLDRRITFIEANIFDHLRSYSRHDGFDMIILDPPGFAKSRSMLEEALRGYKEINLQAMRLLRPGGTLVTCSCSQVLGENRFKRMLTEAASDADCRLIQLDFRGQSGDHPILLGYDESNYLKCAFYRQVGR
ncbi:MAG: class I SAM-dependent rRNA methyltransferase [Spirochaetaceae bacterium]|jgi:23S rRNA (cytosine1962-C5)-methyltransferase|nr:class I SAM-dependent rRNA methyltransferase [Spirochaetaceae bacterium]